MSRPRRPDPPPLETDDVAIVAAGTVAWGVGLVVLVVARLAGARVHPWWIELCGCGAALGLAGIRYCQRRKAAIERDRSAAATAGPALG